MFICYLKIQHFINFANKYIVSEIPLIYLLGLNATKWPNDCLIDFYKYDENEMKKVVVKS